MLDTFAYHSPEDNYNEAMDYEFGARYDRWDGYGDRDSHNDYDEHEDEVFGPIAPPKPPLSLALPIPTADDDCIPF